MCVVCVVCVCVVCVCVYQNFPITFMKNYCRAPRLFMQMSLFTLYWSHISTYKYIQYIYMLSSKYGFGQSMDCLGQSMDPYFERAIHGLSKA